MITIGITQNLEFNEYRVYWHENGRDIESKAAYETDATAAVGTLLAAVDHAESLGLEVEVSDAAYTRKLIQQYHDRIQLAKKEDIQDRLWHDHGEEFDSLYMSISKATGKEPTPAMMVSRFQDTYPELYKSTIEGGQAKS